MKRGEPTRYVFVDSNGVVVTNGVNAEGGKSVPVPTMPAPAPALPTGGRMGAGIYGKYASKPPAPIFHVRLTVGSREFSGEGTTAQAAKHNAASKALKVLKENPPPPVAAATALSSAPLNPASMPFVPGTSSTSLAAAAAAQANMSKMNNNISNNNGIASNRVNSASINNMVNANGDDDPEFDDLKSPISLIHESALKRNLTVVFEVR